MGVYRDQAANQEALLPVCPSPKHNPAIFFRVESALLPSRDKLQLTTGRAPGIELAGQEQTSTRFENWR